MMNRRCPVCKQELPRTIDASTLQARLKQAAAPEVSKAARELAAKQAADVRAKIKREFEQRLRKAESEAARVRREVSREVERARREAERDVKKAAVLQNEAKIELLESQRELDRNRFRREKEQLQRKVEELCRKLDSQPSEQIGNEAELNLFAELKAAFPSDRIEQVGRGKQGADIVHDVLDGARKLGRIVYESKNTGGWQNEFISKAKLCQSKYDTPHVLIVSRAFPRKKRGLCVLKDVPIVEPRMAIALAEILRDGIVELGKIRCSSSARDGKAQQLFDYIISPEFTTRFRQISECVMALRERQDKERDWHERTWQSESKIYDQLDQRRREIAERVRAITSESRHLGNGRARLRIAAAN